jgi:hypothetical protein
MGRLLTHDKSNAHVPLQIFFKKEGNTWTKKPDFIIGYWFHHNQLVVELQQNSLHSFITTLLPSKVEIKHELWL